MRSPKYLICGFFEISCITAESYMKRKKCLNTGTHRRHTLRSGHSIPRAEQKQAQSLSGKPRSTPTGRQICQKAICSSLPQPNPVRNETGGDAGDGCLGAGLNGKCGMGKRGADSHFNGRCSSKHRP